MTEQQVKQRSAGIAQNFYNRFKPYDEAVCYAMGDVYQIPVRPATKREDTYRHIDFFFNSPYRQRDYGVDVKNEKRFTRRDDHYDYKGTRVEMKNVNGKKGWICGDEDYVGFTTPTGLYCVNREDLLQLVLSHLGDAPVSSVISDKPYSKYQRKGDGRDDYTVYVPMRDIVKLRHFYLPVDAYGIKKKLNLLDSDCEHGFSEDTE